VVLPDLADESDGQADFFSHLTHSGGFFGFPGLDGSAWEADFQGRSDVFTTADQQPSAVLALAAYDYAVDPAVFLCGSGHLPISVMYSPGAVCRIHTETGWAIRKEPAMAIDSKIQDALNEQINHEITAAYSYLAMVVYFDQINLAGFAFWMRKQHEEELAHAAKLFQYLLDRGGSVELGAIPKPSSKFDSVAQVFETALKMEQQNTASINAVYALAKERDDYATLSHMQWFIDEQVEEEKIMEETLGLVRFAGDDKSALLTLNNQMATRQDEGGGAGG
jgi:ferritin